MSGKDTQYDKIDSAELVESAYHVDDDDQYNCMLSELHRRGGQVEFCLAMSLVRSDDALRREIGAQILGRLGWEKDSFHDESVDVLISLLGDECDDVVEVSAFGLGLRHSKEAIPHLLKLLGHAASDVRHGVAYGLSGYDDELAVSGLITLSDDEDDEVRNWAIFGLGQQCEMDSPEIRSVFVKHLNERNPEIRGEAMIGLALRKDMRVKPAIIQELEGELHGTWAMEAARKYPDPDFISLLKQVRIEQAEGIDEYMIGCIDDAIAACVEGVG
ncbi:MAG: HEAT repeat domain-containing protein [Alphaproteobacteria bacterium]